MAEFKTTEWEYSNEKEIEKKMIDAGYKTLFIKNAKFNPENKEYILELKDIETDAEFEARWWMDIADKNTGNIVPNTSTRGTLVSLGKALSGKVIGVPAPADVVGGVVCADVQVKESTKGNKYPRIFKFDPAPKSVVEMFSSLMDADGKVAQYSVDDEE